MKAAILLLCFALLAVPADREGNFRIRFDPTVVLQANAPIPFAINVTDDRNSPLFGAQVTLQIETPEHTSVQVFKAPPVAQGSYVAKPIFPKAGQWSVYVEVRRSGQVSALTKDYDIPESAP